MALVTGRLVNGKPIVEVTLADALAGIGQVSPPGQTQSLHLRTYRALLDTGADGTCVCDHVIAECGLRAHGMIRMIGALGQSRHRTYMVSVGIQYGDQEGGDLPRGLFQLEPLQAAQIKSNSWFDVLIGTDVLSQHEFALTRGGGFRLELF